MFPERPGTSRQLNSIEEVNVPSVQAYNPNLAGWFGRRDVCRLTSPRRVTLSFRSRYGNFVVACVSSSCAESRWSCRRRRRHGCSAQRGASLAAQGGAPAVVTNTQAGRKFRAFVKFSQERPTVVDVTARGLTGNQVLLRVEAAQTCYSNIDQVLKADERTPTSNPSIVGHGGVGIVEAIGPQVISTRVGDRVILNLHAACGRCWNCLNMRSDKCRSGQAGPTPIGTLAGRKGGVRTHRRDVGTRDHRGRNGHAHLHEHLGPRDRDAHVRGRLRSGHDDDECPVEVASDVVIFGAGPVGLVGGDGGQGEGRVEDHRRRTDSLPA